MSTPIDLDAGFDRVRLISSCLLLVTGLACSGPEAGFTPVHIDSFTASPEQVAAGGEVTLSWSISGDVEHVIVRQAATELAASTEATGSVVASNLPAGRVPFSLVVVGRGGDDATAELVLVTDGAPAISSFDADRTVVSSGGAVRLSWKTVGATSVSISEGATTLFEAAGAEALEGAWLARPTTSVRYTLMAANAAGERRAEVAVAVLPLPSIELSATPARTKAGEPVQVSWSTVNATELSLRFDDRPIFVASKESVAAGTTSLSFNASGTLTAIAVGPGGPTTRSLDVEVIAPPKVERLLAMPSSVVLGDEVTLEWALSGADDVTLTANGAPVDLSDAGAQGSLTLAPTESTLFVLTGEGEGGRIEAQLLVTVYGLPVIEHFGSDRAEVFRNRTPALLSWKTTSATVLSIADADGELVDVGAASIVQGSVPVSPVVSTSYVMTLVGPGGIVKSAPVAVTVSEPPPLVELSSDRVEVLEGQPAVLTWVVEDFESFTLTANDVPVDLTGKAGVDSLAVTPAVTTQYVMKAVGPGGETTGAVTVAVVRPPHFVRFSSPRQSQDGEIRVTRGASYTVEWEATDATGVTFNPPTELDSDDAPFVSIRGRPGTVELTRAGSEDSGSSLAVFPSGFRFPFFGASYASARMLVDGYVCFGGDLHCGANSPYTNQVIPNATKPNSLIAPFWDDLRWTADSRFLMKLDGQAPNRQLTLEWHRFDLYYGSQDGALTFQAVLFESGDWEIRNAPRAPPTTTTYNNARWGGSATIGVEGPDGRQALVYAVNEEGSLCSEFVPGTYTDPGECTAITRIFPKKLPATGTATLVATQDDILRMKAYGPQGGVDSPQLVVKVFEPASANELTASRTHVGAGEPVQLTWSAGPDLTVVKSVAIDAGGVPVSGVAGLSGSITVNPLETTSYRLSVGNAAGDHRTLERVVTVGPPTATFEVATPQGPLGDPFAFSWTTSGASTLVIEDPDGQNILPAALDVSRPADRAALAASTWSTPLTKAGVYTLKVSNASAVVEKTVEITLVEDLRIVSFTASSERQTQGASVTLAWETFNASRVVVSSDAPGSTSFDSSAPAVVRLSAAGLPMGEADTTFTLTAYGLDGDETLSSTVTVTAAPRAQVSFTALPSGITWNETTTLSWSTSHAERLSLFALVTDGATMSPGAEVLEARDKLSGTLTRRLNRTSSWRLVAYNELGTPTQADVTVVVEVDEPQVSLTVSPSGGVPRGGYARLTWTADQAESLYLWRPDPAAPGEKVQVPFDAVPYGFVDISATGSELTLVDKNGEPDFNEGASAPVAFPDGFVFPLFGQPAQAMAVHANGFVQLGVDATSDFPCGRTLTCASDTASTTDGIKGLVAPFWDDLSACVGASQAEACASDAVRGRAPGRVHWQLTGVAPSRVLTVQWTDWDFAVATAGPASLTFQARLHENGDVEFQYKKLDAPKDLPAGAGDDGHSLIEALDSSRSFVLNARQPMLASGDGYRIYLGARPSSGSLRTFFDGALDSVTFRAVAENVLGTATAATVLPVLPGVDDLLLAELMIDPVPGGDDTGREWIEVRNTTAHPVNLRGFTLQTSGGSFTFAADAMVPARVGDEPGLVVVGQSTSAAENGGVPVTYAYGPGVTLDDAHDVVVLRYEDVLIDRVEYDTASGWTVPAGRSLSLSAGIARARANDAEAVWCRGRSIADPQATSTPGQPNPPCWRLEPAAYDASTRIEVTGTGRQLLEGVSPPFATAVPLGFAFPYFGRTHATADVSVYGHVGLSGLLSSTSANMPLPHVDRAAGALDGLYPFWDALGIQADRLVPSQVLVATEGSPGSRRFIVHWAGFRYSTGATYANERTDFSLVLTETGGVEFHYHQMLGSWGTGAGATIGVEALNDALGITHAHNTAGSVGSLTALRLVRVQ